MIIGEVKKRKELGLDPKGVKVSVSKPESRNLLSNYPYYPAVIIVFALIFDWTKFNLTIN